MGGLGAVLLVPSAANAATISVRVADAGTAVALGAPPKLVALRAVDARKVATGIAGNGSADSGKVTRSTATPGTAKPGSATPGSARPGSATPSTAKPGSLKDRTDKVNNASAASKAKKASGPSIAKAGSLKDRTAKAGKVTGGKAAVAEAPDPALPAKVTVHNGHPVLGLNLVIDGEQRARLVPPGAGVSLVLDAGPHVVEASMAQLPDRPPTSIPSPVLSRITVAGRALDVLANGVALRVSSGAGPTFTEIPSALEPTGDTSIIKWKAPATLESILAATFGLLCTTGGVIAQVVIGRTRVRDERTRLRMQLAARRSLADLPPLTIGVAARKDAAKAPSAGSPPRTSERPPAAERRVGQLPDRQPIRGGRVAAPRRVSGDVSTAPRAGSVTPNRAG